MSFTSGEISVTIPKERGMVCTTTCSMSLTEYRAAEPIFFKYSHCSKYIRGKVGSEQYTGPANPNLNNEGKKPV